MGVQLRFGMLQGPLVGGSVALCPQPIATASAAVENLLVTAATAWSPSHLFGNHCNRLETATTHDGHTVTRSDCLCRGKLTLPTANCQPTTANRQP